MSSISPKSEPPITGGSRQFYKYWSAPHIIVQNPSIIHIASIREIHDFHISAILFGFGKRKSRSAMRFGFFASPEAHTAQRGILTTDYFNFA
ncbi:MAG: hypothetical protein ACTHJ1_10710 [Bordetella sp.]